MTVIEIVRAWLQANGYDGLFHEGLCACEVDGLAPCGDMHQDCTAGHKFTVTEPDPDCDGCPGCEWHMVPGPRVTHEEAQASLERFLKREVVLNNETGEYELPPKTGGEG